MTKTTEVSTFIIVCALILFIFWFFSAPSSTTMGNTGLISKSTGGVGGVSADSKSSPLTFYSDFSGTTPVSQIDWGTIMIGSSKDSTVYVRNQAQRKLSLTFETSNWTPANVSDFMSLSWDTPQSLSVQAEEIKPIIFSLTVASNISGIDQFSFDILIWYS